MGGLSYRADQTDAVNDQGIAGEHVEQQDSLKHLGQVEGDLHRDLRAFAADECQREEQPGDQDADRIEPAEKRDDDRGEAVARATPGSRCPIGPATSMMPASPASAPEIGNVKITSRSELKPEKRAARGAAPTSRI